MNVIVRLALVVAGLALVGSLACRSVSWLEGMVDLTPHPTPVVCASADGRLVLFPGGEPRDPPGPCAPAVLIEVP